MKVDAMLGEVGSTLFWIELEAHNRVEIIPLLRMGQGGHALWPRLECVVSRHTSSQIGSCLRRPAMITAYLKP